MILTKLDLIEYALRSLGEPVVEVNVTEQQIADRLNDTLGKFKQFHFNGMQRVYLTHQITPTDMTNKYISVPDSVISVVRVMPYVSNSIAGSSVGDGGLFSVQYQVRMNDLYNINSGSTVYYEMLMQNLSIIDEVFNGQPLYRHTMTVNKLYLDGYWGAIIREGMYVAFEAFVTTDPEEYNKVWDENWVKEYFTQQVKKQWGVNLKKFKGINTIGGVQIDGQEMYDEAMAEIARLEEQLREVYEEPPIFLIG